MPKNEGAKGKGLNQYSKNKEVSSHDESTPLKLADVGITYSQSSRSQVVTEQQKIPPKLEDIGISKMQSSRYQSTATLPEEVFEEHIVPTMESQNR